MATFAPYVFMESIYFFELSQQKFRKFIDHLEKICSCILIFVFEIRRKKRQLGSESVNDSVHLIQPDHGLLAHLLQDEEPSGA
jgi:hypothetical protein